MSSTKLLLGILTGAAAGAALGILFTQDKGSSIRERGVPHSSDDAKEIEKKFNEFGDSINLKIKTQQVKPLVEEAARVSHDGHLNPEKGRAEVNAAGG